MPSSPSWLVFIPASVLALYALIIWFFMRTAARNRHEDVLLHGPVKVENLSNAALQQLARNNVFLRQAIAPRPLDVMAEGCSRPDAEHG